MRISISESNCSFMNIRINKMSLLTRIDLSLPLCSLRVNARLALHPHFHVHYTATHLYTSIFLFSHYQGTLIAHLLLSKGETKGKKELQSNTWWEFEHRLSSCMMEVIVHFSVLHRHGTQPCILKDALIESSKHLHYSVNPQIHHYPCCSTIASTRTLSSTLYDVFISMPSRSYITLFHFYSFPQTVCKSPWQTVTLHGLLFFLQLEYSIKGRSCFVIFFCFPRSDAMSSSNAFSLLSSPRHLLSIHIEDAFMHLQCELFINNIRLHKTLTQSLYTNSTNASST